MPKWKNRQTESFNDGVLEICAAKGRSLVENKAGNIRFGNRTVGVSRFCKARIASDKIDRLISVPYLGDIQSSDVILIDGAQYKISHIQDKFDSFPPCKYLAIEKIVTLYADERKRDGKKN